MYWTAGATVSINGQPTTSQSVALEAPGSSTPISIEVTAPNGNQKTYLVTVNKAALGGDNNLQSLSVTSIPMASPLTPGFMASTRRYTVNVDSSVNSVTVAAQLQVAGATVSINGQTTTSLPVVILETNTQIDIDVMAPNGSQKTYTVVVSRSAPIPPPMITATPLPNGNVGVDYSQRLEATGRSGSLTWTIISGSLPVGLILDTSGLISGKPTIAGAPSQFTVQVTDALQQSDTQGFSIEIFN